MVIQASDIKIGDSLLLADKRLELTIVGNVLGIRTETLTKNLSLSSVFIDGIGWLNLSNYNTIEVQ